MMESGFPKYNPFYPMEILPIQMWVFVFKTLCTCGWTLGDRDERECWFCPHSGLHSDWFDSSM